MIDRFQYSPWSFWDEADDDARTAQLELQRQLPYSLGERCFVSELASLDLDAFDLGDRSYVAAGAYLTGTVKVGADCSLNPYTVVRGQVTMGDGVRIGAHTSILGFNHTMSDPDVPVFKQPLQAKGIVIGDDVWIGSHVVILDGVTVGSRTVLAAGAVVVKDVPDGAIVGGNPARVLRYRVPPAQPARTGLAARVAAFADTAREQADAVLARSWDADLRLFADRPGAPVTVRAQTDAIELADLLLGTAPPQLPAAEQVERLRGWQDADTGGVAQLDADGVQRAHPDLADADVAYHVEAVGYALDLLGSAFPHPLTLVTGSSAERLAAFVDDLPWASDPWHAGHWVDALGTAIRFSDPAALPAGLPEALFGWLTLHVDRRTGMWGQGRPGDDLLLVNGFYRASRGTLAQFGVPVPHPERVIDTVLAHARNEDHFAPDRRDACNVLDIAHPLWLTRGTGYRAAEVRELAESLLGDALGAWVDGQGFAFRVPGPSALDSMTPGLQGTEMWLAIVWYLADLAGVADALGYRPRGIHRPEPAV
ncbi:MAG TPA: DapH/DapD/GlmU-related protein [Rhodoglobus sp.]|nr:DapH/DapD/GlmU-related protein [Rhodoglobus sp.]